MKRSSIKPAPSDTSTYPALWNHHAELETQMICQPDCQLEVRIGMEKKASKIWKTAGRAYTNRDFGLGSQPLAVALTKRKNNWRHRLAKCELCQKKLGLRLRFMGQQHLRLAPLLVARQPSTSG